MGFLKRQQKTQANIRFTDHDRQTSKNGRWTSDDTVEGIASFRTSPGVACARITVTLKGVVTVSINESPSGSLQPNWRTERVRFLSVGREAQPRTRSEDDVAEVPFRFDLRECSRYSSLESGLPPSLDSKREHKSFHKQDSTAIYGITYTVTASAFSHRGLISSTAENIQILPIGQPEPPSYGSLEVAGEHFTASTRTSHSKFSLSAKRHRHDIDLVGQEPSALVLQSENDARDPSTSVELLLKLSPAASTSLSNLPQQAHIHTQLISTTRIFPDGVYQRDTGRQHSRDQDSQTRSIKYNAQDYTLSLPPWEIYKPDDDTGGFAIAKMIFLYRHPKTERLLPTFSTPILSRSYALNVKVSLPEDGGQSLKLPLPVQVMHESIAMDTGIGDVLERKFSAQNYIHEVP